MLENAQTPLSVHVEIVKLRFKNMGLSGMVRLVEYLAYDGDGKMLHAFVMRIALTTLKPSNGHREVVAIDIGSETESPLEWCESYSRQLIARQRSSEKTYVDGLAIFDSACENFVVVRHGNH